MPLHPEYQALVEQMAEAGGPPITDMAPDDARAMYRAMQPVLPDVPVGAVADRTVPGPAGEIPVRVYTPEGSGPFPLLVWFHGGGWVIGDLDTHDTVCRDLCTGAGCVVVAVDYPLAPEHHYPEDLDAVWAAYGAVRAQWPGPVVLAGDSAGGTLCAGISHKGRDEGMLPDGQVLIYPHLGGDHGLPSYVDYPDAPQLTLADVKYYTGLRHGGTEPRNDPGFFALQDSDFAGLPPTVCVTAQCDPLTSDSDVYCSHISAAGGKAVWINERGLVHGYLRARGMSQKARASFDRICRAISTLAHGAWPVG